jgi:hypothetical protein
MGRDDLSRTAMAPQWKLLLLCVEVKLLVKLLAKVPFFMKRMQRRQALQGGC